jgi:hypothetical protein
MRSSFRFTAAVAIALCMPVGAAAQHYRFDLGVLGGGSWFTSALDREHLGTDGEVQFDTGLLAGAQAGFWFSPRVGLRANFGFADRSLDLDSNEGLSGDGETELLPHVNLWTGTGDLLFRFAGTPAPEFERAEFLPYLAFGLGARWVNAAGPGVPVADNDPDGDPDTGSVFTVDGDTYFLQDQSKLLGRVALGSDVHVSRALAFRLEVGDMMWKAPIERVQLTGGNFVRTSEGDIGSMQHELYGTAGIHLLFGLSRAGTVTAMAAPPPPPVAEQPAPPPPPAALPEPVEETVSVCVIDPMSGASATRTMTAFYRPANGDTLVDDGGRRIPLGEYVAGVRIGTHEDWYVTGRPLTIEYGTARIDYTPYGMVRVVEDVVVLGAVDGLPVFADASVAEDFRAAAGSELRADSDLEALLVARPELRAPFADITTLYVASRPVGCEFAPLQRMEEVRKNRF